MKKPLLLIGSLLFIVIALAVVRMTLVNSMTTTGIELVDLQTKLAVTKKENVLLKEQYLQAASYTNITAKAQTMGFAPVKSELNITAPLPLALR
jgi:cell division protein FtsL